MGNTVSKDQINDFLMRRLHSIEEMEAVMRQYPQMDLPVQHFFSVNGMYCRRLFIPKDMVITGRVHKFGYVDIMISGHISVATPGGVIEMQGFNIMEGYPGRKRAGYAHEDTNWITVHRIDNAAIKNPDDIRDHLTVMTLEQFQALPPTERALLPGEDLQHQEDQADFQLLVEQLGLTQKEIDIVVNNIDDTCALPAHIKQDLYLHSSAIHGTGVFARRDYIAGETIGPARIGQYRTWLGRYVNHSKTPNTRIDMRDDGSIYTICVQKIHKGDELTSNYRETLRIRKAAGEQVNEVVA